MAARVDPRHVRARHQSMHHFVANAPWDGGGGPARGPRLGAGADGPARPGGRVDRGRHRATPRRVSTRSGVARQYCGALGKQDNCQVAVSVSLANDAVSRPRGLSAVPAGELGAGSAPAPRRRGAGRPSTFQPKWQLALAQIRALQAEGVPPAPVVADAGYGDTTEFREALTAAGLAYVVGRQRGDHGVASRPGAPGPRSRGGAGGAARRSACGAPRAHQPGEPQAPGGRTARLGVADGDVARGHARRHALALRPAPGPARASR